MCVTLLPCPLVLSAIYAATSPFPDPLCLHVCLTSTPLSRLPDLAGALHLVILTNQMVADSVFGCSAVQQVYQERMDHIEHRL